MAKYIVFSTVGTSITKNITALNFSESKPFFDDWKNSQETLFLRNKEKYSIDKADDNLSAEIRSLTKLYEKLKKDDADVELDVHLLCTDTIISPVCAWCIQQWFEGNKEYGKVKINFDFTDEFIVRNLRVTENEVQMEKGFLRFVGLIKNKATKIEKEVKGKTEFEGEVIEDNVIINVTGGYKAIIPYSTILASIYGWDIVYTHEEDKAPLLTISKIPLSFDTSIAEMYHPLLHPNNMLDTGFVNKNVTVYEDLIKYRLLIKNQNGKLEHSVLGSIFFNYIEEQNEIGHKDLMSFVVEYKIMELRSRETYISDNQAYLWVSHSIDFMKPDKPAEKETEIDLLLQNKDRTKCIAVEVKASGSLKKIYIPDKKSGMSQITKQLNALKREQSKYGELKEFHLIIYDVVEPNGYIKNQRNPNMMTDLQKIKEKIPNGIEFKVWEYSLLKKTNKWHYNIEKKIKTPKNPYQEFMQDKIYINNLIPINNI